MNKLILAAATAATVLGAGTTLYAPTAEAGMRFGIGFHPIFRPHFHKPHSYYHAPDRDEVHSRRRSRTVTAKKKKVAPLVKFADGAGRQFDPASNVWFDGKSRCYFGEEQFTFKNNAWYYGSSKWTEKNGVWKTNADEAPELVSCESVPSFAAKANANAAKSASESSKGAAEEPKTPAQTAPKIKTAEGTIEPETAKSAPERTECKKYFPSIGQMLIVPCGE